MATIPDSPSEDSLNPREPEPGAPTDQTGTAGTAKPQPGVPGPRELDRDPSGLVASGPGELLDQVLTPLLADFEESFARGQLLLEHCPDRVLPAPRRGALRERLNQAQAGLAAARALRAAAPTPMALDMATITPWHELVVEVWSLSAAMRAAGVVLP